MNAEIEIKKQILIDLLKTYGDELTFEIPDDASLLEFYEELTDRNDRVYEAKEEFRYTGIDTDLPCPSSRHYESKQVARKLDSGVWVSWTFWYGGGKHGYPQEIDWISDAYIVDCHEQERLVVERTFFRVGESE